MELYTYFRSSAAWRVRIVLALKGLDWTPRAVDLGRGAEQIGATYRSINPQGMVPALALDDRVVTQSIAICELLEELHPDPPLLPADPFERAYVREVMAAIAADIHPLTTPRIKARLTQMGQGSEAWMQWVRHWTAVGLASVETLVAPRAGRFCLGDAPTLADAFLIPQIAAARTFDCTTTGYPTLMRIAGTAAADRRFASATPEAQADAR